MLERAASSVETDICTSSTEQTSISEHGTRSQRRFVCLSCLTKLRIMLREDLQRNLKTYQTRKIRLHETKRERQTARLWHKAQHHRLKAQRQRQHRAQIRLLKVRHRRVFLARSNCRLLMI